MRNYFLKIKLASFFCSHQSTKHLTIIDVESKPVGWLIHSSWFQIESLFMFVKCWSIKIKIVWPWRDLNLGPLNLFFTSQKSYLSLQPSYTVFHKKIFFYCSLSFVRFSRCWALFSFFQVNDDQLYFSFSFSGWLSIV